MAKGGYRAGSGRPKGSGYYGTPTTPIRVPECLADKLGTFEIILLTWLSQSPTIWNYYMGLIEDTKNKTETKAKNNQRKHKDVSHTEQFNREHFNRLLAMADDKGQTWDFSDNDTLALQWVLRRLDSFHQVEKTLQTQLNECREALRDLTSALGDDFSMPNEDDSRSQWEYGEKVRTALARAQQLTGGK